MRRRCGKDFLSHGREKQMAKKRKAKAAKKKGKKRK
jgi:hypothetical protein